MATLVMKFGGASVETASRFGKIADLIIRRKTAYPRIVVVVSAMMGMTDRLLSLAKEVHSSPPKREQDMLVSVGERISSALLAMALDLRGIEAISFTGSQSGIVTTTDHSEALILDVRPWRIIPHLDEGKVAIVAGFQGVSKEGEITTLGRGGSDTTAVALAAALGAAKVEFYKDVPGIFTADPKKDKEAVMHEQLSYEEAVELTQKGAKILHFRAVQLAARNKIPLHVLSFDDPVGKGTWIGTAQEKQSCVYEVESHAGD